MRGQIIVIIVYLGGAYQIEMSGEVFRHLQSGMHLLFGAKDYTESSFNKMFLSILGNFRIVLLFSNGMDLKQSQLFQLLLISSFRRRSNR